MRFSLKRIICAALMCVCVVLTSGCFPVHSILGDTTDYSIPDKDLEINKLKISGGTQTVSGVYPEGKRAFMFKKCTYESDINNFRLIDSLGNTMIYFYTGIRVHGNSGENLKGYYDVNSVKRTYFWTIAAYNFETKEYQDIASADYDIRNSDNINGNPAKIYSTSDLGKYMVNVGFDYYLFTLSSKDNLNYYYNNDIAKWTLSGDNKKKIREELGIKGNNNSFCCTDLTVKVSYSLRFAATFMALPNNDDDFNQENAMFELEFNTEIKKTDNGDKVIRYIDVKNKESKVLTVAGGNIISSNPESGNCIYVLEEGKRIKFGIDNRDRKTSFHIDVSGQSEENRVLQSFSVEDWCDDKGNLSDQESTLELVFKNRVDYYKIERYSKIFGIIAYRAKKISSYPIDSFTTNYLSSDDMPSIGYYPHGINLCSTEKGFRCINTKGKTLWSATKGAAYFSAPYGEKTLVVGFNDFEFERTVHYFDEDGKAAGSSQSKSEFTLAQLPFATVKIH